MGKCAEEKPKISKTQRIIAITLAVLFIVVAIGIFGYFFIVVKALVLSSAPHGTPRDTQSAYISALLTETPSEFPQYRLCEAADTEDTEIYACVGETLSAYQNIHTYEKGGEEITVDGDTITTSNGQETIIDNQYLMEHNQVFYKLINSERFAAGKEPLDIAEDLEQNIGVAVVFVFDDQVFIVTQGGTDSSSAYPVVLFHLDMESQTVSYVDFGEKGSRLSAYKIVKTKTEEI